MPGAVPLLNDWAPLSFHTMTTMCAFNHLEKRKIHSSINPICDKIGLNKNNTSMESNSGQSLEPESMYCLITQKKTCIHQENVKAFVWSNICPGQSPGHMLMNHSGDSVRFSRTLEMHYRVRNELIILTSLRGTTKNESIPHHTWRTVYNFWAFTSRTQAMQVMELPQPPNSVSYCNTSTNFQTRRINYNGQRRLDVFRSKI